MKVSFIIAGVQKGGTTALDKFLRSHPQLAMPKRKEVHFFDDETIDWNSPDYSRYLAFFAPSEGQLLGEATPIYTYWQPSIERIYQYNPSTKLIVILRDPVKRAFSHWEMEVSRQYDRYKFPVVIRDGRVRVTNNKGSMYGCHRIFSYVERGFYAPQVERLFEYFPRDQVLFLDNDQLRNEQRGVLDRICEFLGVLPFSTYPENENILPTRKQTGLGKIADEDKQYLADLYRGDTAKTAELTGLDVSHWISS